ncbi:MAG: hypothetical protein WC624_05275 [Candidatus Margulisiibacteriota bacterium]
MLNFWGSISSAPKTEETNQQDSVIYQGAIDGGYISSVDNLWGDISSNDVSGVNSSGGANGPEGTSTPPPNNGPQGAPPEDDNGNYIQNSPDEHLTGLLGDSEKAMDDLFGSGISPDDYWEDSDGDGYLELKAGAAKMLMDRIKSMLGLRIFTALLADAQHNLQEIVRNALIEQKENGGASGKKSSLMESTAKSNAKVMEAIQNFFVKVFNNIMKANQALYQSQLNASKEEASEWHDSLPFCDDEESYLEEIKAATDRFNNAMQKSLNALKNILAGSAKGTLLPQFEGVANNAITNASSDSHFNTGQNGYIDENTVKADLLKFRRIFIGFLNVQRLILMIEIAKSEMKNTVYEGTTGSKGASSNSMRGVEQELEGEVAQKAMMFDKLLETTVVCVKLKNQQHYIELQQKKASGFWHQFCKFNANLAMVGGVVLAIVGLIFSWTGIGLAIALLAIAMTAAIAKYGASKTADDAVSDEYNPAMDNKQEQKIKEKKTGDKVEEQLVAIQNMEMELLNGIGLGGGYSSKDSSGNTNIDTGAMAKRLKALNALQNVQRLLLHVDKMRSTLTNIVFSNMTGISSYKGTNAVVSGIEATLKHFNTMFQKRVSDMQTYAEAQNMENSQKQAMDAAEKSLGLGLALAAVTAVLSAISGGSAQFCMFMFTTGMAVGQALGQVWANYGKQNNGYTGTRDLKTGRIKGSKGDVTAQIDDAEYQMYQQALENGTINAGGNKKAVNSQLMVDLQKMMGKLLAVRTLFAALMQLKQQLVNMVASTTAGIATAGEDGFLNRINRADYENMAGNLNYINQLNETSASAHNRGADATLAVQEGITKGVVIAAIAAVCGGVGGSALIYGSSVIGMADAIITMIFSAIKMNQDNGKIVLPTEEKASGQKLSTDPKKQDTAGKLRLGQEKAEAVQITNSSVSHFDGGYVGFNTGIVSAGEEQVSKMYRVAEVIANVQQAISNMKASISEAQGTPQAADTSDMFSEMVSIDKQQALSALESQASIVRSYVSRENEKAAAGRRFWQATVQLVLDSVILSLQVKSISAGEKNAKLQQAAEDQNGYMSEESQQKMDANQKSQENAFGWMIAPSIANVFSNLFVGMIYDASRSGSEGKGEIKESVKENQAQKEQNLKESKGLGQSMQALESSDTAYSQSTGAYSMSTEQMAYSSQTGQELADGLMNTPMTAVNLISRFKGLEKNNVQTLKEYNHLRARAFKDGQEIKEKIGCYSKALEAFGNAVMRYQTLQQEDPNNAAALQNAYLDVIEKAVELQVQAQVLSQSLDKLDETARKMREDREKLVKDEHKTDSLDDAKSTGVKTKQMREKTATISERVRRLKELQSQIKDAPPEKAAELRKEALGIAKEIQATVESIEADAVSSPAFSALNEAMLGSVTAEFIQEEVDKALEKQEKDKGKPIEEMSYQELEDTYSQLYEKEFVPARTQLQAVVAERGRLQRALKQNNFTPEKKSEIELQLSEVSKREGMLRQKIQGFNRLVGKMDRLYYKKTQETLGVGKHLERKETIASQAGARPPVPNSQVAPVAGSGVKTSSSGTTTSVPSIDGLPKEADELMQELQIAGKPIKNMTPQEKIATYQTLKTKIAEQAKAVADLKAGVDAVKAKAQKGQALDAQDLQKMDKALSAIDVLEKNIRAKGTLSEEDNRQLKQLQETREALKALKEAGAGSMPTKKVTEILEKNASPLMAEQEQKLKLKQEKLTVLRNYLDKTLPDDLKKQLDSDVVVRTNQIETEVPTSVVTAVASNAVPEVKKKANDKPTFDQGLLLIGRIKDHADTNLNMSAVVGDRTRALRSFLHEEVPSRA